MSEGRHGWIDLLAPDGPFLAASALDKSTVGEGWPTRLDPYQRRILVATPGDSECGWDDSSWDGRRDRVERLLVDLLGYQSGRNLEVEPGITARHFTYRSEVEAAFTVHAPEDAEDIQLVVVCGPDASDRPHQLDPDRAHQHGGWVSTPVQRAALLARHAKAPLALVSNGSTHILINVVTGTMGHATWHEHVLETERPVQDAFVALLHKKRVLDPSRSTSWLIQQSHERQRELTDTLGRQVRSAAEVLVNAISRANRTTRGRLLSGVTGHQVYGAATTVLMRVVFLLVAEERHILSFPDHSVYYRHYAISSLLDHLESDAYINRSAMQRRATAWQRVLALSRAIYVGVEHPDLRLTAYGGDLFNPERYPFLEARLDDGTQLDVGVVDDLSMLTVLRRLQYLDGQRISFRSLDVEQIGHVYEALLDHSAVVVSDDADAVLGLFGKSDAEPEMRLEQLEAWAQEGREVMAAKLAEVGVAGSTSAIARRLDTGLDSDSDVARTLSTATGNDQSLRDRVYPFAPLLRTDARGVALVFLPGDLYVTETRAKRDTGTAYTHRSLAEKVARHALDPLIYDPGPQNESDPQRWRPRPPQDLLALRVCDPAVGSGAILVAAVRHLAEALLQSRIEHGELDSGALASAVLEDDSHDLQVDARREVVANCIYGVDRDPMAAEMAKMSLWLVTMARDRPFTFLDHAIKVGDSLLGITSLQQLKYLHLKPRPHGVQFGAEGWWDKVEDTIARVDKLRHELMSIKVIDIEDTHRKAALHVEAEEAKTDLELVADALVAACLSTATGRESDTDARLERLGPLVKRLDHEDTRDELRELATKWVDAGSPTPLIPRRFMHWPLEFPEVFGDGNRRFDAVVANPPFMGSQDISGNMGSDFRNHLIRYVADGRKGKSDLIGYFALRIAQIANQAGFLATNSITQGQTLKVGLLPLTEAGWTISRAVRMTPWPGGGVNVSQIWMRHGPWEADTNLNGESWTGKISPTLEKAGEIQGQPKKLRTNANLAFQGYQVIADGFEITAAYAVELIAEDPDSAEVVRNYVNGDTINGPLPRHDPQRRVIDFGVMTKQQAAEYVAAFRHVEENARPEILEKAQPRPDGRPSSYARWADRWWQFWSPRKEMREAIADLDRVLALARTSKVMYPVFVPADWCHTDALVVFAYDDYKHFGLLTSVFHWWWAIQPPGTGGSSLKTDPRYTPTTSFQTFPQPTLGAELAQAGKALDRHREGWMATEGIGLTDAYNRVNDPDDDAGEVVELRRLHVALDHAVQAAYAESDPHHPWEDLALDHDFYDCGSLGVRYTVSAETRTRMLDWLLELNFRRWAEEHRVSYESVLRETGNA